jgi:hypothetical protein
VLINWTTHGLDREWPRDWSVYLNPPFHRYEVAAWQSRVHLFRDCECFAGKIVLTRRVVWFQRHDGVREAPKENSAWFTWSSGRELFDRQRSPIIRYA